MEGGGQTDVAETMDFPTWSWNLTKNLIFSLVFPILECHAYSCGNRNFLHLHYFLLETSFNWLAKDRGHTVSNGNQNFIVACGVSCLFQTVWTAA